MSPGQQNPALSLTALFQQAHDSQPLFNQTGAQILGTLKQENPDLFAAIEFENGGVKSLERAQAKIAGDYAGDASKITDLTRGRIIVDNAEQVEILRSYIAENGAALGIEKIKDRFAIPSDTHFRDINMKMRLPNGHVAELRIEHRGLLEAARHTHETYEQIQNIERTATIEERPLTNAEMDQRQKLLDHIRDAHDSAAIPAGFNDLLAEEGLAKLTAHALQRAPLEPFAAIALPAPAEAQKTAPALLDGLNSFFAAASLNEAAPAAPESRAYEKSAPANLLNAAP